MGIARPLRELWRAASSKAIVGVSRNGRRCAGDIIFQPDGPPRSDPGVEPRIKRIRRRLIPSETIRITSLRRHLIRQGLERTRGSYKKMLPLFRIPDSDYKRFMDFLRRHNCNIDFREYRKG